MDSFFGGKTKDLQIREVSAFAPLVSLTGLSGNSSRSPTEASYQERSLPSIFA